MNDWLKDYRPTGRQDLGNNAPDIDIGSHYRHTVLDIGLTITAVDRHFVHGYGPDCKTTNRPAIEFIGPNAEWIHKS